MTKMSQELSFAAIQPMVLTINMNFKKMEVSNILFLLMDLRTQL